MMSECDAKIVQTAESIEHTRREGGQTVGMQLSNLGLLKGKSVNKVWNRDGRLLSP